MDRFAPEEGTVWFVLKPVRVISISGTPMGIIKPWRNGTAAIVIDRWLHASP